MPWAQLTGVPSDEHVFQLRINESMNINPKDRSAFKSFLTPTKIFTNLAKATSNSAFVKVIVVDVNVEVVAIYPNQLGYDSDDDADSIGSAAPYEEVVEEKHMRSSWIVAY